MIPSIRPDAVRLLKERQLTITFVDVGSRNGLHELGDLAPFVEAYGFEPNPREYDKLLTGKTDEFLMYGYSAPAHAKVSYFPYALGNFCGRHEFYLTPGPGSCGLLEPNLERLREIVWKGHRCQRNLGDDDFAACEKIEVEVKTLEAFADEHGIQDIDYLKIDVEGSEFEVLQGARSRLPRTGVIKVEICFIPLRKGQKLFSHVDLLLREFEFDLLRYEIAPAHVGYKERSSPVDVLPGREFPDPHGQVVFCDAIYVNRGLRDPNRALVQALVLADKGYLDEACYVLRNKTDVRDEALLTLLRTAHNRGGTVGQRLRVMGHQTVDAVLDTGGRLVRRLRRSGSRPLRAPQPTAPPTVEPFQGAG